MTAVDLKQSSPLMKFKQFLRGRRSMPDLRHQITPNLNKTTIQGTVKHDWGGHFPPNNTRPIGNHRIDANTPAEPHERPALTARDSAGGDDSHDNESMDSAFSFNVSVQYYKEKDDTTMSSTAHHFDSDERVMELMNGGEEDEMNWDNHDDVMDIDIEDETDNLFNRDLFGIGVLKRAQSNLELN